MLAEWGNGNFESIAINDCVIDIGPPFRILELDVYINQHKPNFRFSYHGHVSTFRGDGLIIATPTGSTAYNMSAMGPIVQPTVESLILTPKNPHRLSVRPVVVDTEQVITIPLRKAQGAHLIIDGQEVHALDEHAIVQVRKYAHKLRLVENGPYWGTLTKKLKWGC